MERRLFEVAISGCCLCLEDPSKQEIAENHVWLDDFDISPVSDGFTRAISEPCGESDIHKAVRLYKSSEHIHTVGEDGAPGGTPLHVYAARSRGHAFKTPLVSKNPGLPTKVWAIFWTSHEFCAVFVENIGMI